MRIRQSDIQTWERCPLQWRFRHVDGLAEERSSAPAFGSALHEAVRHLEETNDLAGATALFERLWAAAEVDYFLPRTNFKSYLEKGRSVLRWWWDIIQWNATKVLAREYAFEVPLGQRGHRLLGTVDKLEIVYLKARPVVQISDYKTNVKLPTREYLRHNVQFTAYCYATTRPEFWSGLPDGDELYARYLESPRQGEWVALAGGPTQGPKRVPAGERTERDYRRLEMVVDAMESAIAMGIYIPNLTGAACEFCEFRKACGLPTREEEGLAA